MNDERKEIREQVLHWIEIAEEDIVLARHAFTLSSNIPYRLIGYHAQQCAEKYIKAFLVSKLVDFPYTHQIEYLLELVELITPVKELSHHTAVLSNYAVAKRYPGEYQTITKGDAETAVHLAEKIRDHFRILLEKDGYINK
jgi:HEPN domain-containing protein